VVDLSLVEPLFSFLGPQALVYDQLGLCQERLGKTTTWTSPRNTYLTSDGRWVAVSASSQRIAERLIALVGRPDLIEEPWFAHHAGRSEHVEELDREIGGWIAQRTQEEVLAAFEEAEAAVGPVYSIADIFQDPHFRAREMVTEADHPDLGTVKVPQVVPFLSATPGSIRNLGGALGEHNQMIYGEQLGHDEKEIEAWKREETI
jgi:crotonobetainyl-CoA:carnitine CoA-transferase CaiB-like acyl-CoA transferase